MFKLLIQESYFGLAIKMLPLVHYLFPKKKKFNFTWFKEHGRFDGWLTRLAVNIVYIIFLKFYLV